MSSITFVVPTLGIRGDWLDLTLSSIVHQDADVELLLVGPKGRGIEETSRRWGGSFVEERRKGLSCAINDGFLARQGTSEYFAWLADDDVLAPEALSVASSVLDRAPEASFVFGRVRYIDKDGNSKWLMRPGQWSAAYAKYGKNFIPQPGSLIRADAFTAIGLLDEELKNSMDLDLFLKLQTVGSPKYVGRELAAFRVHPGSISVRKGNSDETFTVASRASSGSNLTRLARVADQVLLRTMNRIPGPAAPTVQGWPYHVLEATLAK